MEVHSGAFRSIAVSKRTRSKYTLSQKCIFLFHENHLLADDSHEISIIIPYFFRKLGKMFQNLSSAAIVIGALRVNASPLVLNPD